MAILLTMYGSTMHMESWGENLVGLFLARRSAEKENSSRNVLDASGNIVNIALHQNTQCIVRTADRNINAVMIELHRCFPIH